jgi:predicted SAM-dependent methyltransferase
MNGVRLTHLPRILRSRVGLALYRKRLAREERAVARAHDREVSERLAKLRGQSGLLLNVGSSSAHVEGWVSLDLDPDELGLPMDATKPWPFDDASARAVRTEHMIEHLSYEETRYCIQEIFRVLEPEGVCRICTPDLEATVRAFLERDPDVLDLHRSHGYVAPTWAHFVNNYMRMWGHRFLYDFDALSRLLLEAGFRDVERAAFNDSRHAELAGTDRHDMGRLDRLVLCVDAVKPPPTEAAGARAAEESAASSAARRWREG